MIAAAFNSPWSFAAVVLMGVVAAVVVAYIEGKQ